MRRRQAAGNQTTPAFDALLRRPFIRDDPAILPVWNRYLAGCKDADFQALVSHYLPLVLIVASALKRRANGAFREDTDAYLSDGILGLCRAICYIKSFDAEKFGGSATIAIRRAIMGEMRARRFGGRREAARSAMLYVARCKLTRSLGRPPTREELAAELAGRVHNPARFVAEYDRPAPAVHKISDLETEDGGRFDAADPRISDPGANASEDETIRLAMERLGKSDRKIFAAVLRGDSRGHRPPAQNLPRTCPPAPQSRGVDDAKLSPPGCRIRCPGRAGSGSAGQAVAGPEKSPPKAKCRLTPRHFDRPTTFTISNHCCKTRADLRKPRRPISKKSAFSIAPRPVSHCILQCCLRPVYISSGFKLIFPSAAAPSFLIVSPYFARFCGLMRSGSLKSRYSFHFTSG